MENNYTAYNLMPKDKEDRKLFWKFRIDDVLDLFRYICYCETLWLLARILGLVDELSMKNLVMLCLGLTTTSYHWLVFLFRHRLKDRLAWITVILYTTN